MALPSEAQLMVQLRYLKQYLDVIRKLYPHESLLLAGHSAGGVLGRLYMVTHPDKPVGALITFAPPLGWLAPLIGRSKLNRSQNLCYELVRERPRSLLFWLNRQEHPSSIYVSIVRDDDLVVSAWSQDMNQVAALRGRASKIVTHGGHGLGRQDGKLLLQIFR